MAGLKWVGGLGRTEGATESPRRASIHHLLVIRIFLQLVFLHQRDVSAMAVEAHHIDGSIHVSQPKVEDRRENLTIPISEE